MGDHVITEIEKEPTKRICDICDELIYKIFQKETLMNGVFLSRICVWDQMFTCSENCQEKWYGRENLEDIEE